MNKGHQGDRMEQKLEPPLLRDKEWSSRVLEVTAERGSRLVLTVFTDSHLFYVCTLSEFPFVILENFHKNNIVKYQPVFQASWFHVIRVSFTGD